MNLPYSATDKVRENRLRRLTKRHGLWLVKSRCRTPSDLSYGGFMLIEPNRNFIVAGGDPFAFSLSLADVEAWLKMRTE